MKRLSTGVLATLIAACCGLNAVAAPSNAAPQGNIGHTAVAQAMDSTPAANFGTPPSGQIPIIFNDHHVYAKPDTLKQGRVLAALVKGGTVLIPLRSMFEQMGATVSYDASSKTVTVQKTGASVMVTVGKPEVMINGESRPLDVAPMIWQGQIMVPIRVISEGMGAYVQWVPDKQLVVVRYVVATPPPTPEPTVAPTVAPPTPTPTPAPTAKPYKDLFVAGDYIFDPKVYNEFSPGNSGNGASYQARGAYEFDLVNLPWMVEGDFRQYQYPHNCSSALDPQCFVRTIGGLGQSPVAAFNARDSDFDGRFGIKVANPRIYVGVGYLWRTNNYGYPVQSGFGFGAEKLPDLDQKISVYGSAWYYPSIRGNFQNATGTYALWYRDLKYQIGGTWLISGPIFLDLGWTGDAGQNKTNAPSNFSHNAGYIGFGLKF